MEDGKRDGKRIIGRVENAYKLAQKNLHVSNQQSSLGGVQICHSEGHQATLRRRQNRQSEVWPCFQPQRE